MHKDNIKAKGQLRIELRGPDGEFKEEMLLDNLVVSVGLAYIASRMVGATANVMSHMAIGTGATAPSSANTALGAEAARVALSSSGAVDNVVTYVASFGPGSGTGAITEAGIFNAGVAGTMLNRVTFPVVNKQAGDTLAISWTVTMLG